MVDDKIFENITSYGGRTLVILAIGGVFFLGGYGIKGCCQGVDYLFNGHPIVQEARIELEKTRIENDIITKKFKMGYRYNQTNILENEEGFGLEESL